MAGMGIFPERERLRPADPRQHYDMAELDDLIGRSALNFRSQKEVLRDIPLRKADRSLQVYFW